MRLNSRLAGGCALLREAALAAAGPGLDGDALRACLAHPVLRGGRGGRQGPRSAAPSEDVSENLFPVSSKSVTRCCSAPPGEARGELSALALRSTVRGESRFGFLPVYRTACWLVFPYGFSVVNHPV